MMWNSPSQTRLDQIPRLYETEHVPLKDVRVYLHFYLADSDWFITEYDGDDLFFGYAILNGDTQCAEWGYISFRELKEIRISYLEVECESDTAWQIRPVSEVEKIHLR